MLDSDVEAQKDIANEESYESLVAVIEASQGMLSLLIASCEPGSFQERLIERYESELAPEIHCYRVRLNQSEPSITAALRQLAQDKPELKLSKASVVITVTGIADLLTMPVRETDEKSALEKFFGYLQWTREALREFPYPIVLWITPKILRQISMAAPDFWSWRNGVFRFTPPEVKEVEAIFNSVNEGTPQLIFPEQSSSLPIDELLKQVESIKAQKNALPALASLYDRLGQAYASRVELKQSENLEWEIEQAISFFKESIKMEVRLGNKPDQVNSLIRLGQLYGEASRSQAAKEAYQQALEIAREINDKVSEAVSLAGLGNTYQQSMQDQSSLHPEQEKEESNNTWPQEFLEQLERMFEMRIFDLEDTGRARFLLKTFKLIWENQGDVQQIYPIWEQQQTCFDEELLKLLPTVATHLLRGNTKQQTLMMANSLIAFGDLISQFPLGKRWLNLELGITAYQQALTVTTQDAMPLAWAYSMSKLGLAYSNRNRNERSQNLEQAITTYRQALTVMTQETMPVAWTITMSNLATAYTYRLQGNRAENLERAIETYLQVLTEIPQDAMPIQWANTMNNLAFAYRDRIRGERSENLELAITAYQQALTVITRDTMPVEWAQAMHDLASAYIERIRGDRAENLEQAIAAYKQALTVRTRDEMPVEWAGTMASLSLAYSNHLRGDRAENLEQAIAACRQSLTVVTRDLRPVEWAQTMNNLAIAYSNRIRGDRAENLEQAITAYLQVLMVMTQDTMPVEWAQTMNNLALAYSNRIRGDRAENLEQALTACKQALMVRRQDVMPIQWANTMNNLALAYSNRLRGNRAENLEKSIAAYEQALTVVKQNTRPIEWARIMMNLANVYPERLRGDRAENLEKSIVAYEQSLMMMTQNTSPVDWAGTMYNLANVYVERIQGKRTENIETAITAYRQALAIFTPERMPDACRKTARHLANLYSEQKRWIEAVATYKKALQAAENLYQSANLLDSKASVLSETADLPRRAAYGYARTGNLRKAVEILEQGRARGLSESLGRDRTDLVELEQVQPDLYVQYTAVTEQLRNLENQQRERAISSDRHSITPEILREHSTDLRQQLNTLIQNIRQVPNYENFLTLPSFENVQQAGVDNNPLVYLLSTPAGSLSLIVTSQDIQSIWLDNLTEEQLFPLLQTWFSTYDQSQNNHQAWLDAIDLVTRQLWEPLMQPLIHHLKTHNLDRAILIPTGDLSFLPLHAAWTEDEIRSTKRHYALDDIHFTYVPNATSLTAARAIANDIQPNSILAIDNPRNDLPNSEREISTAVHSFSVHNTILNHQDATIAAVKAQLSKHVIAHFSCHGTANLTEPLNSGLLMHDGILTLKDIFALNLAKTGGLRLTILSACETGLQGIENTDEAISLPTGLLQAGVAAIIGSLWSVDDLSTMMLLTRFYDLWRTEGLEISQALRQAQQLVRDTTNQEKYDYLKITFQNLVDDQRISQRTLNELLREFMSRYIFPNSPQSKSFAHPFYWAAFSYVGA